MTSVIFSGDPVAPQALTRAATGQELLPRVDHHRLGAHRHRRLRPHLRPAAVGARLRRVLRCGPHRGDRCHVPVPVVLRPRAARPRPGAAVSVIDPALFFAVIQGIGPDLTAAELPERRCSPATPRPAPSPSRRCPTATWASGPRPTTAASTTPPRSGGTRRSAGPDELEPAGAGASTSTSTVASATCRASGRPGRPRRSRSRGRWRCTPRRLRPSGYPPIRRRPKAAR